MEELGDGVLQVLGRLSLAPGALANSLHKETSKEKMSYEKVVVKVWDKDERTTESAFAPIDFNTGLAKSLLNIL